MCHETKVLLFRGRFRRRVVPIADLLDCLRAKKSLTMKADVGVEGFIMFPILFALPGNKPTRRAFVEGICLSLANFNSILPFSFVV